ncbi:choice-of-anchor C family protein [Kitasatospora sp. NPDC056138]|uniref:choice-of-anchor C family protein n=1 Tax=Kitasatospora sp. NPDC056138 TaxID=3345724 RepID=UPI0035DD55D8
MFSMRAGVIAATSVLLAGVGATASAQTVSRFDDGSFENPRAAANSFTELSAGQAIGPWRVTAGTVDLIGAGFWQAAEGDQSVDLNGAGPGAVAQTFTTVPGATYTVTYALAGNPGGGAAVRTGRALIDGQDFQDFSFDTTGKSFTNMGYVNRQFTFRATNSATTVAFASTTAAGPYGPVVDDVRIERCAPCPTCSNG